MSKVTWWWNRNLCPGLSGFWAAWGYPSFITKKSHVPGPTSVLEQWGHPWKLEQYLGRGSIKVCWMVNLKNIFSLFSERLKVCNISRIQQFVLYMSFFCLVVCRTLFDTQNFKVLCVCLFSFMVASFALLFRYSSPLHPKVVFSSGSLRVYLVIQSHMGMCRDGKEFRAHVPFPRFGWVF